MQWFAQAPSNIALIKYMGKKDAERNIPINASLSYTLNDLLTSVTLEKIPGKTDSWEPLDIPGGESFKLTSKEQTRFLDHLSRIKLNFSYSGAFLVRSSNNFPSSTGLASSASSFAALTKCAILALSELTKTQLPSVEEQAQLSRLGSGSSCRSFFSPWALWEDEEVKTVELPYTNFHHQVIIASHEVKPVSSRNAHQRIESSPLYQTRAARATEHLKLLLDALQLQDWKNAYEICWREFSEMHQLFESAEPPFSYRTEATFEILEVLQKHWKEHSDGPIVTMDAGPNVHLLYREDQTEMMKKLTQRAWVGNYDII